MGASNAPIPVYLGYYVGNSFIPSPSASSPALVAGGSGSQANITTTASDVVTADLNRQELALVNLGPNVVYLNHGATATASSFPLQVGGSLTFVAGMAARRWSAITASGTATLGVLTGIV